MKYLLIILSVIMTIGILCSSCRQKSYTNINELEYLLGTDLSGYEIEELNIEKKLWSPDYVRPYNVYISFKTTDEDAEAIFSILNLEKYSKSKSIIQYGEDSIFCFYQMSGLVNNFWSIVPKDTSSYNYKETKSIKWWQPDKTNLENSYAFFYKMPMKDSSAKIVPCKDGFDGRIIGQYVPKQHKIYILIKC